MANRRVSPISTTGIWAGNPGMTLRNAYTSERVAPTARTSPRILEIVRVNVAGLRPDWTRRSWASVGPRTRSARANEVTAIEGEPGAMPRKL